MSDQSSIQWTDSTWNIVTGCTRVGPGCARCYIERTPPFRMQRRRFERVGNSETTGVTLHWDRLEKVPRGPKVFTPSLGDLFHEDVPFEFIHDAFDVMSRRAEDRIFQVLTKRPERAREFFAALPHGEHGPIGYTSRLTIRAHALGVARALPNVWVGVSIENARFTWRADVLREIPAAVRFISAEPLLGSLYRDRNGEHFSAFADDDNGRAPLDLGGIDWVIIGGESGPGARPFHLEHAREIIDACLDVAGPDAVAQALDVGKRPAVFVKQLGAKPIECVPAEAYRRESLRFPLKLRDRKGGDLDEWPADLRIREMPEPVIA